MTFCLGSARRLRRLVPAVFLAAAASAAVLPGMASAAATAQPFVQAAAPLVDLMPGSANPTDGAQGRFYAFTVGGQTTAVLVLTGLSDSVGQTFGAHVHIGPCVAGNGALALGHYRDPISAAPSPTTEVWLDFTVLPGGVAVSRTTVPFVIPEGAAQSVGIHAAPTDNTGAAGARMACLPVGF